MQAKAPIIPRSKANQFGVACYMNIFGHDPNFKPEYAQHWADTVEALLEIDRAEKS